MSSVVISGDTSGTLTIAAPAVAGTNTITLPAGTGTAVVNNVNGVLVSDTAKNSTSGTSIDFTTVPSWAKRITIMYSGVSTSGTSAIIIQIGSGSFITSGYAGGSITFGTSAIDATVSNTTGFNIERANLNYITATSARHGTSVLTNITGNTWVHFSTICSSAGSSPGSLGGGSLALSGVLDRIRITTTLGTDTFDAGTINLMYE